MKLLATFLLTLLATLNVHAQGIIWSVSNWAQQDSIPGIPWEMSIDHVADPFLATPPIRNPVTRVFLMRIFTNDIGRSFFVNAQNGTGFPEFVTGLTDGVNQFVRVQADNGAWQVLSENNYFRISPSKPDLAGYNITQISFQVNNFYEFYNATEDSYFRRLDYSLDFYGAPVPEPGTWALLGLGSALLWSATRRRK